MAKKATAPEIEADDFTGRLSAQIEKEFGEGVMISGEDAVNEQRMVIPWTPVFDTITSGGIEEGSWVGLTGPEKIGKTTAALTFAANAQKPEYGSRPIYYDKVEGRLSMKFLRQIEGLDLSPGKFHIIQSTPADPKTGKPARILTQQEHLKMLCQTLTGVPGAVVIIDSISAYCEEREMDGGIGTETRGGSSKNFAQFCRLMNQVVPINKSIVIGITQMISNTSGMGATKLERVANAWKYQCDYQLRAVKKEPWKSGEEQIGLIAKWACNTSKLGPPGMTMDGYLRFGTGYDRLFEVIKMGLAVNLIQAKGAWLKLAVLAKNEYVHLCPNGEPPQFQGAEKLYRALKDKPEWRAPLEKEVLALASGLVNRDTEE